jgi:hypothetical protein
MARSDRVMAGYEFLDQHAAVIERVHAASRAQTSAGPRRGSLAAVRRIEHARTFFSDERGVTSSGRGGHIARCASKRISPSVAVSDWQS